MQEAWHLETTVLPGGRVEVIDAQLPAGAAVDVFVLPKSHQCYRRSAVDILASAPGQRLFKTAADVDDYLQAEHDAWDR
ncbi:MAG: hypothetical protein HC897_06855 [Thermoanaerobaculia bacterium]|nr:hypothetical protein [Thermoanaerobaculia bacterium]